MEVGQIMLASVVGLTALAALSWFIWRKVLPRYCPCVAGGSLLECWNQIPLVGGYAQYQSRSPYSSSSSSSTNSPQSLGTGRSPSLNNYATFSGSSSSEWPGSTSAPSEERYIYIPPLLDSARLTMSYPMPRNFQRRDDLESVDLRSPGIEPAVDTADIAVAAAEDDDMNDSRAELMSLLKAMKALPTQLAKIRSGYDENDIRNHIL